MSTPEPRRPRHDFAGFYRATVAPLRRYLARLTGNRTEAQDLAHDAYARIYPAMRDGQVETPQAFLYTTARRLAINQLRHRELAQTQSVSDETLDANAAPQPGVPQTVIARQELEQLERALAQLPPGCRAVLLLRKVEMLPHDEIARRLGVSRSNVEKQHVRALRLLREILDAQGAARTAESGPAIRLSSGKSLP
ncbi:MAG: sigma-70 family RNA polymerase sigma factor [Verrucomicrobia bacterium]|nr:sigma-70 family RNA polymerase sigma factor [Verrucomicrobiota bacterium]